MSKTPKPEALEFDAQQRILLVTRRTMIRLSSAGVPDDTFPFNDTPIRTFLYDGTSMRDLGGFPGWYHVYPWGMNNSDQIAGQLAHVLAHGDDVILAFYL